MANRLISGQTLITTDYGKYVWYPALQLVDWIPKGQRKATFTLSLLTNNNTELRAMIAATNHMLKMLKEMRRP